MSSENPLVAQCPQCQSRFRLTTQHLEAAKGWVQCGVCGHVFFSGLAPAAQTAPAAPLDAETPPAEAPLPAEAAAGQNSTADSEVPAPEGSSPVLSGLAHRMAEAEGPVSMTFGPKLESIILVDPNAAPEDSDPGPLPVIEPRPEPGKAAGFGPASPPPSAKTVSATSSNWIPRQPVSPVIQGAQKKTRYGWLWWLVSIILLLALATQLVWFLRDSLAASHPGMRPALAQMCEAMDCTLGLPRDPQQVVILGSDLQTENDGRLVLTITLANKARTNMAWPVLELTLTDVEDQPLARRVFAPSEYLSAAKQEAEGIPQMAEVPIELTLQSKDIKAAGYRLRMFY